MFNPTEAIYRFIVLLCPIVLLTCVKQVENGNCDIMLGLILCLICSSLGLYFIVSDSCGIDINKACDWLEEHRLDWDNTEWGNKEFLTEFRKAMEE